MKKDLIQFIKILTLGLVVGLSVASVSAWTAPSGVPPTSSVVDVINISGSDAQSKGGSIVSAEKFNVNGILSSLALSIFGNSSVIGLKVTSLNQTNNPSASFPAPICVDAVGTWTLCTTPPPGTYTLTISVLGSGSGSVTSYPAGINNCTGTCSASFSAGTTVNLSADADPGSQFTEWGGLCSGGVCYSSVTMSGNTSVTATFNSTSVGNCSIATADAAGVSSTLATVGGYISDDGGSPIYLGDRGIHYGLTTLYGTDLMDNSSGGTGSYIIPISALTPNTTYHYKAFASNSLGGTCAGADKSFTTTNTAATYKLTVTKNGTGSGSIVSSPPGISCGSSGSSGSICNYNFNAGTAILLGATPSTGNTFGGWGGNCTTTYQNGATYMCSIAALNAPMTISATFGAPNVATVVTTAPATAITNTTATIGGNVTNNGGATVTSRGVLYSLSQSDLGKNAYNVPCNGNPSSNPQVCMGIYTMSATSLTPNKTYYYQAFAHNAAGNSFGNIENFYTNTATPTITTLPVNDIGATNAVGNGTVVTNGTSVIERGIVWSRNPGPTTWNNCNFAGDVCNKVAIIANGGGNISSVMSKDAPWGLLTKLAPNTLYYVKAYAITDDPVTHAHTNYYGNEVTFTTATAPCSSGNSMTLNPPYNIPGVQGPWSFSTSNIPGFPCAGTLKVKIWGAGGGAGGGAGATGNPLAWESAGAGGGGGGEGGYVEFKIPFSTTPMSFSGTIGLAGSGGGGSDEGQSSGSGGGTGGVTTLIGPGGINITANGGGLGGPGHWVTTQYSQEGTAGAGGTVSGASSIPGAIAGSIISNTGAPGVAGHSVGPGSCNGDGGHGGSTTNGSGADGGQSGGTQAGGCGSPTGYAGEGGASGNLVGNSSVWVGAGGSGGGGGGGGALGGWSCFIACWPVPHSGGSGGYGHNGLVEFLW